MLGTIELGLQLFPNTRLLYIVNDNTTTGKANKLRFENIRSQLPEELKLTFSEDKSMQQVQSEVARLDENSLVLLMSFTMDKDNYRFSFSESAQLITRSSARPVLGFWDFYLGNGIIGGVITGGFDQGQTAGKLGIATLTGNTISTLPVVETSPVIPTIDHNIAHHFGVDTDKLPNNVHILNRQLTFLEQYRKLIYLVLVIFGLLLLIVLIQATRIMRQHHNHNKLAVRVELDPLTGTKNREFFHQISNALLILQ
ncbi:hypothetical protein [Desulfopila sp. IMCC35008]|uniref:hypothetical protein n=1 Tax=Desulfopila sp. IMCC35008 TaxID=2653858 RepID=UPI0013D58C7D|nr:hypothetical protein [Desulfopila sp. IMCC35008]